MKSQRKITREEERNKRPTEYSINNNQNGNSLYLWLSTISINGLNSLIKRHKVAECKKIKDKRAHYMLPKRYLLQL